MAAPPPRPSAGRPAARASSAGASGSARSGSGSGVVQTGSGAKDAKAPGTYFLGRYRVVEEIGVGGMASVHLGRMDGPGGFQKWVAIKRIHQNLVEDDQFVDMFLDEARIAAGINHANVAQVFDLGKDEGTYWIAMEYLHGEPLRELMRRCEDRHHPISPDIAARICADAAEGLHAAHELRGKNGQLLGLVHRDVTPHNLFVTYDGYTKVVDFGIAKVADRLSETRAGTLKGKLAYMSPEQVRGQDDVDRTTDVFALGVVLWELTTGHRLFRMDTDLDTLEKVQACIVPPPSTVIPGYPIELESVVMKALAKKKAERFQSAREFSRALQTYLLRRGVFIGPEEVANFVRDLFADRIQQREAHLAWAADVTSTINIGQLEALKAARKQPPPDEVSIQAVEDDDDDDDDGPRTRAVTSSASEPQRGPGPPAPPPRANGAPRPPAAPPPPPAPTVPGSLAAKTAMGSTSLVDDDEDIPTTVATREQVKDLALGPKPAAGAPAQPPPPAAGASIRSTAMGLGIPQPSSPAFGPPPSAAPAFGPPPSSAGAGMAHSPPQSGPGQMPGQMQPGPGFSAPGGPGTGGLPMMGGGGPQATSPMSRPGPQMQQQMQQHQMQQQQQHQQPGPGFAPPSFGAPPQFPGFGPPMQGGQGMSAPGMAPPPPSSQNAVETALSLPRPDPAQLWMEHQARARAADSKSTAVLVAVAVLTAICVLALAALLYFKFRPQPAVPAAESATSPSVATSSPTATAASVATAPTAAVAAASSAAAPTSTARATTGGTAPGPLPTAAAAAGDTGFLTVICKPFCDNVRRGGASLGPSPIVKNPTPPGQHRVTLSRSGMADKVVSVIITPGETYNLRINMK